jgi:hypothetical protein
MLGSTARSVFVAAPVVVALAVACGGSVSAGPGTDGGTDSGTGGDAPQHTDASVMEAGSMDAVVGPDVAADNVQPLLYDGTTGKMCASDADCIVPNGPGIARCSSSVFAPEQYYPVPVCILPTCTPVSGQQLHFCDGPDDPSSPGICVPSGGMGGGTCLPKCTYDKSGGAQKGCVGKDTCWSYTTGMQGGVGYCWGGCTSDLDCTNGQKCQTDQGLCVEGVVLPTKMFGTACTKTDQQNGVCNCLYGNGNTGYCSGFCVVGGAACPMGATCDAFEYRQYGYATQNPGMAGYCTLACSASDAGPNCPANVSCTNIFAAGPDCIP